MSPVLLETRRYFSISLFLRYFKKFLLFATNLRRALFASKSLWFALRCSCKSAIFWVIRFIWNSGDPVSASCLLNRTSFVELFFVLEVVDVFVVVLVFVAFASFLSTIVNNTQNIKDFWQIKYVRTNHHYHYEWNIQSIV